MTIIRIEHIQLAMPAGKETEARHFYGTALGLAEVPKPPHLAKRGGCWFESGQARVHLGVDPDFHAARKAHPAFLIDETESLASKLEAAGHEVRWDEGIAEYKRFFVDDAVGNRLEFMAAIDL